MPETPYFGSTVPRLPPAHIRRHHLFELLDRQADFPFVIVRGPAGSGKTTLIADWVGQRSGGRTVWITLDHPATPLEAIWAAAAKAVTGPIGRRPPGPAGLAALLNEQQKVVTVVIDDFHYADLTTSRDLIQIAQLLHRGRFVLLTRDHLALSTFLTRLTATVTIDPDQLALSAEEIAKLSTAMGAAAAPAGRAGPEAATLRTWTGGHVQFTRLALEIDRLTASDDGNRLLAGAALEMIPAAAREFALRISLLPLIDTELAATATGTTTARPLLRLLEDSGLGRLDETGRFEYHGLLGAMLRRQAETSLTPETRQRVRSCAAEQLRTQPEHAAAAFELLARSGRIKDLWPHVASTFADTIPADIDTIVRELDPGMLATAGALTALSAVLRGGREAIPSIGLLNTVDAALADFRSRPTPDDPEQAIFQELAILALHWAAHRYEKAAAHPEILLANLRTIDQEAAPGAWSAAHWGLLYAAVMQTMAGGSGLAEASRLLLFIDSDPDPLRRQRRSIQRAFIHAMRGENVPAEQLIAGIPDEILGSVQWTARLTLTRAAIALEHLHPIRARELLEALEPDLADVIEWPFAILLLSRSYLTTDPGTGLEEVDRLLREHDGRPITRPIRDLLNSAVGDLALAAGDVHRAKQLTITRTSHDVAQHLTSARIALITGDPRAIADLRQLTQRNDVFPRCRAQAFLLLAVHLQRNGDPENAQAALRRAISILQSGGNRVILGLIPHEEIETIAAEAGLAMPAYTKIPLLNAVLAALTLSKRERLVLGRLATGASLREIAAVEVVSLSTVKSQTASIYRKLGVNSREQAVALALRRGLVDHHPAPAGQEKVRP